MPALSWPVVLPEASFARKTLLALMSELSQGAIVNKLSQLLDEVQPDLRWALSLQPEVGPPHELIRCGVPDPADREHSGLARESMQDQFPVFTEDPAVLDTCYSPTVARHRGTATALPVIAPGQVLGCLEFYGWLSEGALARLRVVLDGLGAALLNAWRYERILADSRHDDITGLLNTRALRETLHTEVARADRFHHPISMLFVDLDRFKSINDRYGHAAGSALLREVGQRLESSVRRVDTVYRYGGDEFALLLIETGMDDAKQVAARTLQRLSGVPFRLGDGAEVNVRASVGVASYPGDGANADELLEWADRAMFAAKKHGRDRVVSTDDLDPPPQKPASADLAASRTPVSASVRAFAQLHAAGRAPAGGGATIERRSPDPVAAAVTREMEWPPRPKQRQPSRATERRD